MKGERPRIIDVIRKPRKCPVCGGRVWDIIYGTGDMTEIETQSVILGLDLGIDGEEIRIENVEVVIK